MKKAGNKKKAPANSKQGHLNKDDVVSQKLDALMESIAALSGKMKNQSGCVDAAEERQKEAEMSPVSHHTSHTARRASPRGCPDPDQEVEEAVHKRVAKRRRQLPTLPETT